MIEELLKKHKLITDQIEVNELRVILNELQKALDKNQSGAIVEFGCYEGTTSLFISRLLKAHGMNHEFHVYDSFSGLPDKTTPDLSPAGEQFIVGALKASKRQFIKHFKKAGLDVPIIHKRFFEDLSANDVPQSIDFAFLDGDYYSSILASLKIIWTKMNSGSVVVVDDYQSEALPGVKKAVDGWLKLHPKKLKVTQSLAIIYT